MDTKTPVAKPDMMEQAGQLLKGFIAGAEIMQLPIDALDPVEESADSRTVVLAYAVLAVAAELQDIHNVLHEMNQRLQPDPVADGIINPEDASDPNQCPICLGDGVILDEGRNVTRCDWCHGKGRMW